MAVIEITAETVTHKSNTWHKGDQPTVSRRLCIQLMIEQKAIFIKDGCGCNHSRQQH